MKRPSDLVARYGGEEFAVVLAGAEEAGALSVAHWIRGEVEKQAIPHGASSVSDYVTVSIGVAAVAPIDGGSPERLIAAADAALCAPRSSAATPSPPERAPARTSPPACD